MTEGLSHLEGKDLIAVGCAIDTLKKIIRMVKPERQMSKREGIYHNIYQ